MDPHSYHGDTGAFAVPPWWKLRVIRGRWTVRGGPVFRGRIWRAREADRAIFVVAYSDHARITPGAGADPCP